VIPGVFGAVATPDCLREGLSGKVYSFPIGEKEETRRGEGCVEDR
jgi:hypothetical protein